MGRTRRIFDRLLYIICLISAVFSLASLLVSMSRFMSYANAAHAAGVPDIVSTPFEAWRADFLAGLSKPKGSSDSAGRASIRASAPDDSTLRGVYEALKTKALNFQKRRLVIAALQPAIASILAIAISGILWCWLRGTAVHFLWLLVVLVPLLSVGFGSWALGAATNRPGMFFDEPVVHTWQGIWVAMPFFVLALFASRRRGKDSSQGITLAWAVGILLTFVSWLAFNYEGYMFWRDGGTGGANIGFGILMLASPLVIGAGMFLGYRIGTKRKRAAGTETGSDSL